MTMKKNPFLIHDVQSEVAEPAGGFQPTKMVRAKGKIERAQQMEQMARPTTARRGLKRARMTGELPTKKS